MQRYAETKRELALALADIGAVLTSASDHPLVVERDGPNGRERGFKLKLHEKNPDAPLSPIYLNLRTPDNPKPGPLTPEIVDLAARCMVDVQMKAGLYLLWDVIAGVPRAGDPFAEALARLAGDIPCIVLKKEEREGTRRIVGTTGYVPVWARSALVVDDLITKADSKIEAIKALHAEGIEVLDVIVLVDRKQGGREELARVTCSLHSVFTIRELLDLYVEADRMSVSLRTDIRTYLTTA